MSQVVRTYDADPVVEVKRFEHEGLLSWRCAACSMTASQGVGILSEEAQLTPRDLDVALAALEADHARTCSGSLALVSYDDVRYVEHLPPSGLEELSLPRRFAYSLVTAGVIVVSWRVFMFFFHIFTR